MIITHNSPNTTHLFALENLHPKEIQWSMKDKIRFCAANPLSFWVNEGEDVIGEFLIEKKCDNYAELISISSTVSGIGNYMWEYLAPMLRGNEIEYVTGHARLGASWHLAQKYGAQELFVLENWGNTGEQYVYFLLKIPNL